nr:MAG TPA: hypothetical protein [Caudoviricetes sp.]
MMLTGVTLSLLERQTKYPFLTVQFRLIHIRFIIFRTIAENFNMETKSA